MSDNNEHRKYDKPEKDDTVVEFCNIEKSFASNHVLKGANLDLKAGEIHALVGGNGAGKSTLVNLLCGAFKPDAGHIIVHGKSYKYMTPKLSRELGIGTVHQTLMLVDFMDVTANIYMGNEIVHRPKFFGWLNLRAMKNGAKNIIKKLRINIQDVDERVMHMSGGQRQAIAIARAIVGNTSVIMMDEPTAALGVRETHDVLELIRRFRDENAAVLLISHNMQEVFALSDRITVLRLGHTVATVNTKAVTQEYIVGLITGAIDPLGVENEDH